MVQREEDEMSWKDRASLKEKPVSHSSKESSCRVETEEGKVIGKTGNLTSRRVASLKKQPVSHSSIVEDDESRNKDRAFHIKQPAPLAGLLSCQMVETEEDESRREDRASFKKKPVLPAGILLC
eukprot:14700333-Ditylum_brightwellii.AAC.2